MTEALAVKKPRSFLFYLAVAAAILLLSSLAAVLGLGLYARGLIIANTDAAPAALPPIPEMTDAEYAALEKRVDGFREGLRSGGEIPDLTLRASDINALIARKSTSTDRAGDMIRFAIAGDQLRADLSLPLDKAPLPLPRGRFLNASATFSVSMRDGVLIVTADGLSLKGKPIAPALLSRLRGENLARDAYRDPKNAEALRRIGSIEIKDDAVVIKPRRG